MNHRVTLTVGIPAYNEEANIKSLLEEILVQHTNSFRLEKIIVASDGSTDETVAIVRGFHLEHVVAIDNSERTGLGPRLNQLCRMADTDILILLNADISIEDEYFLERLVAPITQNQADLVSCRMQPLHPETFVERSLAAGFAVKDAAFEAWHGGNNVYTCHGAARGLDRRLYQAIHFPTSVAEDAFSYFFATVRGFRYAYVRNTEVFIRLPQTLKDHIRQTTRFQSNPVVLKSFFQISTTKAATQFPSTLLIRESLVQFIKTPIVFATYGQLQAAIWSWTFCFPPTIKQTWEIAETSKQIHA